ncbi:hypothetical protein [Pelagicoccus sp. SDUM812002]|uniref:hypothetical protein n=1 Tax=Pelagicoccus sp. SDUM812002 TaxID=3041266 RepID=UPI00280EA197|nr:hypothetical protein [Pelagicoccus sp. SDUM812002]MDQ8185006.1 hypothetical protein [Pelagicoccus sp. SDUM812002]
MNDLIIIIPVILPMLGAILGLLATKRSLMRTAIGIGTSALTLAFSLQLLFTVNAESYLSLELGSWQAPSVSLSSQIGWQRSWPPSQRWRASPSVSTP